MKITILPVVVLCLAVTLFSCAAEDMETETVELKSANLEVYQTQDLEGVWELESMHSDVAINLNGDNVTNTDIKAETNCFNDMYYEFKADGTVKTDQAKLHFNSTGITTCDKAAYTSTYTLKNDMLAVSFEDKNGTTVAPEKQIKLTDNKQRLHITLTRIEATAYIKNDSGNSTEVINSITTIYKKRAVQ